MERTGLILLATALVVTAGAFDSDSAGDQVSFVQCQDGSVCPDKTTCCLVGERYYACCPYQSAQCCSDHIHCCPHGYNCDVANRTCVHAFRQQYLFAARALEPVTVVPRKSRHPSVQADSVPCPDGGCCNDGETCCLQLSGHYGCCTYPDAVCCSDLASCCPLGYTCNLTTRQCDPASGNRTVAMLKKVNSVALAPEEAPLTSKADSVPCPDGGCCNDGETCCLTFSGHYGCCPHPDAVCCSDLASCCPKGYTCNLAIRKCVLNSGNHTVAMLKKVNSVALAPEEAPLTSEELSVGNVRCPDGNYCLDRQTCCLLTSGSYGCCPFQHAQCCSDHSSCCPEGYQCKVSTHQCIHATTNHSVPMLRKVDPIVRDSEQVVPTGNDVSSVRCPDGNYCSDGQTCCLSTSGRYGCCPYRHAECCSDHTSCCPEGYRCKISTHQCLHAATNHSVPMLRKVDPIVRSSEQVAMAKDVTCPDKHKCLNGQTCCQLASGKYGCCPLPNAVCCEDHKSCCPQGYVCHVTTQTCQFGDHSVPMVRKVPAFLDASEVEEPASNDMCPDGSECDDDQTCCQLLDGSYGCCLYNDAVCCDDKRHCCPQGYQCDMEHAQCINSGLVQPALVKVAARRRNAQPAQGIPQPAVDRSCPDNSTCPDSMTCCPSGGSFSCCPFSDASCCPDGEHCCPRGFKCDSEQQSCVHKRRLGDAPKIKKYHSTMRP